MGIARKRLERLKRETRLNPMPIPSSLEAAFASVELAADSNFAVKNHKIIRGRID